LTILHFVSSKGIFGAERVLCSIVRRLSSKKIDFHLVSLKDTRFTSGGLVEKATQMGLKAHEIACGGRLDLRVISRLISFVKERQIDVIHTHGYKSNFYGLLASKICNIPIVATVHGWTGETRVLRIYESFDPIFLRFFSAVVPVSEKLREKLISSRIPNWKIRLIHNGIDLHRFDPSSAQRGAREKWGIKESAFVVGNVGRLSREKGQTYLLEAMKDIIKTHPEAIVIIVGDGLLKEELIFWTKNNGLKDYVIFTGNQDNTVPLYAMMDAFILPSLTEGIPLTLLEAMAMGKPVVATPVGGVPEIIKDSVNGVLVKPKDSHALAVALSGLIENPELRNMLSQTARKTVQEDFSVETMCEKYVRLYDRVLGEKH